MIRFEDVLPELVRLCETTPGFGDVPRACAVRDLRGRVRLALEGAEGQGLDIPSLQDALQRDLGKYFEGPVWLTGSGTLDQQRLARRLLDEGQPWAAEYENPATGATVVPPGSRWLKIERRLSKQAWLREIGAVPKPPWPLVSGAPKIVVFYSFNLGTAVGPCVA